MALDEKWSPELLQVILRGTWKFVKKIKNKKKIFTVNSAVKETVLLKLHSHLLMALEENLEDQANKKASSSKDNTCL